MCTASALALAGCAAGENSGGDTALHTKAPDSAEAPFELLLNGEPVRVDPEAAEVAEPTTLHTGAPVPVEVIVPGPAATVTIDGTTLKADGAIHTGEITLERLDAGTTIALAVKQGGETTELQIRTAPLDLPPVVFEGDTAFDEGTFYYANLFPTGSTRDYIIKYDNAGSPVFYRNNEELAFNTFGPWEGGNSRGYYYFVEDPRDDSGFGIRRGRYVVLDEQYRVIDADARPQATTTYAPEEGPFAEMHDFAVLGPGHYIFLDYYAAEVDDNGVRHVVPYIQEVDNGRVVWEWDAWDHGLFQEASRGGYVRVPEEESMRQAEIHGRDEAIAARAFTDSIHTNSVQVCPNDGNIIISNRNMSEVMEIERATGEVAWVLGGGHNTWDVGELGDIGQQHDARMLIDGPGGSLLTLYDNRTDIADTSRGLVLEVDEENRKVLGVEEYTAHGQQGDYTGSTRLFGRGRQFVVVGWGLVRPETVLATVFDRDGNALKDITTDGLQMDTYRFVPADF